MTSKFWFCVRPHCKWSKEKLWSVFFFFLIFAGCQNVISDNVYDFRGVSTHIVPNVNGEQIFWQLGVIFRRISGTALKMFQFFCLVIYFQNDSCVVASWFGTILAEHMSVYAIGMHSVGLYARNTAHLHWPREWHCFTIHTIRRLQSIDIGARLFGASGTRHGRLLCQAHRMDIVVRSR